MHAIAGRTFTAVYLDIRDAEQTLTAFWPHKIRNQRLEKAPPPPPDNTSCYMIVLQRSGNDLLKQYLSQYAAAPHNTCAYIIAPRSEGNAAPVPSAYHVGSIPAGQYLCMDAHTHQSITDQTKAELVIYFHAPKAKKLSAFHDLLSPSYIMSFPGTVSTALGSSSERCSILIDTGATHNFVDAKFARRLGSKITPDESTVLCGGNTSVRIEGYVYLKIVLGETNITQKLRFFATILPTNLSIVLGQEWMSNTKAIVNYGSHELVFYKGNKRVKVPCQDTCPGAALFHLEEGHEHDQPLLSWKEFQNEIPQCSKAFLLAIKPGESLLTSSDHDKSHVQVQGLLHEFADVFQDLPPGVPPERNFTMNIPTGDSAPVSRGAYRLTPAEKQQVEKQVADLLQRGMIRPSHSSYSAPVLFVQKKDGSLRMCVDYRALNKVTEKDKHPLPRIDDLIDRLHNANLFSSLDLQSGYHQIRVAESDVRKTAFQTHQGLYEYLVMPFGLCNAPSAFQRQMNSVFGHLPFVLVYLDDILVFSRTAEEHSSHLRTTLELLRRHQFYAKLSKCAFYRTQTKFLGYLVDGQGVRIDPDKVSCIQAWPLPKTASELRSFLGLCNHYKRFIAGYSLRTAPLNELTKPSIRFEMTAEAQKVFQWLKDVMSNAPVLAAPNFEAPYIVVTDASGFGIGAVLLQGGNPDAPPDKVTIGARPIAYFSKRFSSAERNYPVGEQELLAVVEACKKWRCYLEGAPGGVTIVTDHLPNTFLDTKSAEQLSRRQVRWQLVLSRINPRWLYDKGERNQADPISRSPTLLIMSAPRVTRACSERDEFELAALAHKAVRTGTPNFVVREGHMPGCRVSHTQADSFLDPDPLSASSLGGYGHDLRPTGAHAGAVADGSVATSCELGLQLQRMQYAKGLLLTQNTLEEIRQGYRLDPWFQVPYNTKRLQYQEGAWYFNERLVIPNAGNLRERIISEHHDAPYLGHPGRDRTLELLLRHFWWPSMRNEVMAYIETCKGCQLNKPLNQRPAGLLMPLPVPAHRWASVSMDLITQLPRTNRGHTAILVFVDRLTKMVHLAASYDNIGAAEFAEAFIANVFCRHGMPENIVTDRDARFTSNFFKELCSLLQIRQCMSTAYHPESDGQTERTNRTLEEMLRNYISPAQHDWDEKLPLAEFAINNSWTASTGSTPFLLNYGTHPRMPTIGMRVNQSRFPGVEKFTQDLADSLERAKTRLREAQDRMRERENNHRRDIIYREGEYVLLSTKNMRARTAGAQKFLPRYIGPFLVNRRINDVAYELRLPESMRRLHPVFHVSLMKPYKGDVQDVTLLSPEEADTDQTWEVEEILAHRDVPLSSRSRRKRREYFIKWKGFADKYNNWEPESNCSCPELIREYFERLRDA